MTVTIKTKLGAITFDRQDVGAAGWHVREASRVGRCDTIRQIVENKVYISKADKDEALSIVRETSDPKIRTEMKTLLGKIKIIRFADLYKTHPNICRFLRRLCFWGHY